MTQDQVPSVRFLLAALAVGTLLVQLVAVPLTAAGMAEQYPQVAYLQLPYVISVATALLGFEAALLAAWELISGSSPTGSNPAGDDDAPARRWANLMAGALIFAAMVLAGVFLHAGFIVMVGGPPMLFGLLGSMALVPVALTLRKRALQISVTPAGHRVPANGLSGW